jgi:hypothetical protein
MTLTILRGLCLFGAIALTPAWGSADPQAVAWGALIGGFLAFNVCDLILLFEKKKFAREAGK